MGLWKRVRDFVNSKLPWKSFYGTRSVEMYKNACQLLDEAGIDYRVWIDENDSKLVFYREYFDDPINFRRHYNFYIRTLDYRKGCHALCIDPDPIFPGGINHIRF